MNFGALNVDFNYLQENHIENKDYFRTKLSYKKMNEFCHLKLNVI